MTSSEKELPPARKARIAVEGENEWLTIIENARSRPPTYIAQGDTKARLTDNSPEPSEKTSK